MSNKEVLLTKDGYNELVERLEFLKTRKRHEIAEKIKIAREFGDLSENAEYEEAKTEQAFIEGEIMELEFKVKNAVIIDEQKGPKDIVSVGSRVKVLDVDSGEEFEYTIVGSDEADLEAMRISNESPLGQAMIGKKADSVVTVQAPMCQYDIKILQVQ